MTNKLYVGSLSYNTTEDGLKTAFEQAGTVQSAVVIIDKMSNRSKGFGFVEMSTEEEAKKAIDMFNGKELDGRTIIVNEARPMKEQSPQGGGYGNRGNNYSRNALSKKDKEKFKEKYYKTGYYINDDINSDLFDRIADEVVGDFGKGKGISFTKIRQYYDEVNRLYFLIKNSEDSDKEKNKKNIEIKLKILISRAIYDFGRKQNIVPESFVYFLQVNREFLDSGEGEFAEKMEIFKKHFEAIIAYGKGKGYFK